MSLHAATGASNGQLASVPRSWAASVATPLATERSRLAGPLVWPRSRGTRPLLWTRRLAIE